MDHTNWKNRKDCSFTATCAKGLEELVTGEIQSLTGCSVESSVGAITWQGDLASGYRACLWSRFASRVLLEISTFQAMDTDALYHEVGCIDWQMHLAGAENGSFAVDCTLGDSAIGHSRYAALRVKDAIVDQFRTRTGNRPGIDLKRPDIRVHLHIKKNQAILSLDLSGKSLHQRGYRLSGGEAPLKESLAAAIVAFTLAEEETQPEVIVDPMCGSGTLLIEAAMILSDSAPRLSRTYFGFLGWVGHDEPLWQGLVDEAIAREDKGLKKKWPRLIGYDAEPRAISSARDNIAKADFADRIHVEKRQLAHLDNPGGDGVLIVNPPYGERLSEKQEVKYLYRCLGRKIRENFPRWRLSVFTGNPDLADEFSLPWKASHRLYNGPLACRLFVSQENDKEEAGSKVLMQQQHPWKIATVSDKDTGTDFANRLKKRCKEIFKWARRRNISCFRVYDADVPAYNIAVDIYGRWIHVQEYAPPSSIEPELAASRFREALAIIRETLGAKRSEVFIKTRRRQKGKKQYQKQGARERLYEVCEGDCHFLVNFTDYLDTGLFLDHRKTRDMIGRAAEGMRFLNLFGYTGAATVHAAMGGAQSTTTVDLSARYLSRAKCNMALNGFSGFRHQYVQDDCVQWLKQVTSHKYDLIFLDPPTFSNTKKTNRVFDIQRDHSEIIQDAMRSLEREGGRLIFSTNFRRFKLDEGLKRQYAINDISGQTLPHDFKHNRRIHQCFDISWR